MGRKILVVDNDVTGLDDLVAGVQTLYPEIEILTAEDGHEALTLFEEHHECIDRIFTDIHMQPMGGFGLAATIYQQSNLPNVPITWVTGTYTAEYVGGVTLNEIFENSPTSITSKSFYGTFNDFIDRLRRAASKANRDVTVVSKECIGHLQSEEKKVQRDADFSIVQFLEDRCTEFFDRIQVYAAAFQNEDRFEGLMNAFASLHHNTKFTRMRGNIFHDLGNDLNKILSWIVNEGDDMNAILGTSTVIELEQKLHSFRTAKSFAQCYMHRKMVPGDVNLSYLKHLVKLKPLVEGGTTKHYSVGKMWAKLSTVPDGFIVAPSQDLEDYMEEYLKIVGDFGQPLIARGSMVNEYGYGDKRHPFGGFAITVPNLCDDNAVRKAIADVRENTGFGEDYARKQALQPPRPEEVYVVVMKDTQDRYQGAMMPEPHRQGVYVFDFWKRHFMPHQGEQKRERFYFVYDANSENLIDMRLPEDVGEVSKMARAIITDYHSLIQKPDFNIDAAHVLEFTFSDPSSHWSVQCREGPDLEEPALFSVDSGEFRYDHRGIGLTPPKGIDLVVYRKIDGRDARLAFEAGTFNLTGREGRQACYLVGADESPNDILGGNDLGLIITGKGIPTLSHGYFNAMMLAGRILRLTPEEFGELPFVQGNIINYKNNGVHQSISRTTNHQQFFRTFNSLLNSTTASSKNRLTSEF